MIYIQSDMVQKKERILWADICKGLLITLLMFSHLAWVSTSQYGIQNQVIGSLGRISSVWNCFFMSCFFLVSGMFSNFNKPFKVFVWSNFKSLIIPAFVSLVLFSLINRNFTGFFSQVLLYGGGLWFLAALFLSKTFLWGCVKWMKNAWIVVLILLVMSFSGKWLDDINLFPNYWYHRNFLNFTLYLGIGYYFKEFIQKKRVGIVASVAFVLTIVVLFMMNMRVPNVVAIFNESLSQHPLTIWLSMTGSIAFIHLCKLIGHSPVLEFLGRNSLIVYIYHMVFLSNCIGAMTPSLNNGTLVNSVILIFAIVASTLVFCSGIALVMDTKYLRWMKGVF